MNDINIPSGQMGWICPKCGAVLSPTTECPHCMPISGDVQSGLLRGKTSEWFIDYARQMSLTTEPKKE